MKIITLVGTRPEIIRLSETIKNLDRFFQHRLIHSGQNPQTYLNDVFFRDLSLRSPDSTNHVTGSLASQLGSTLIFLEEEIRDFRPDALLILGDTNTALVGFLAKRYGIIVYHIEAGNRSFDVNVPEETNRRIIDHFADFNLCYSRNAYDNLLREGLHPRFISICGSPLPEVIQNNLEAIKDSDILDRLSLASESFLLVSLHRQENVDSEERLRKSLVGIESVAAELNKKIVMSLHPRTKSKLEQFAIPLSDRFQAIEPQGFHDFMALQLNAYCTISDSGSISEEASYLGFPAVTIRDAMERPEALETGSIILTGFNESDIYRSIVLARSFGKAPSPEAYQVMNHSQRVINFIQSTWPHAAQWLGKRS